MFTHAFCQKLNFCGYLGNTGEKKKLLLLFDLVVTARKSFILKRIVSRKNKKQQKGH